ncbi:hypothetical protein [Atlantibacter sp.]|uniref:hypothetical protein n=1 Tax=Atlantibacter sp. TaxID=1903473 RepID=UPI0028AA0DFF|nr:hypothetical protein [Atlantibacter sp.]
MEKSIETKECIRKIIHYISTHNAMIQVDRNQWVTIPQHGCSDEYCIIIHSGHIAVAQPEGINCFLYAPIIINLNIYLPPSTIRFKTLTPVCYEIINKQAAFAIIEQENLWKETVWLNRSLLESYFAATPGFQR